MSVPQTPYELLAESDKMANELSIAPKYKVQLALKQLRETNCLFHALVVTRLKELRS